MTQQLSNPNSTIEYNSLCQIIGNLYVELYKTKSETEAHYSTVVNNLTEQVSNLIEENESLKQELDKQEILEDG